MMHCSPILLCICRNKKGKETLENLADKYCDLKKNLKLTQQACALHLY